MCHISLSVTCLKCEIFNPLGAGVRKLVLDQPGKSPECHGKVFGLGGGGWEGIEM